jgi:hypothetical protein
MLTLLLQCLDLLHQLSYHLVGSTPVTLQATQYIQTQTEVPAIVLYQLDTYTEGLQQQVLLVSVGISIDIHINLHLLKAKEMLNFWKVTPGYLIKLEK